MQRAAVAQDGAASRSRILRERNTIAARWKALREPDGDVHGAASPRGSGQRSGSAPDPREADWVGDTLLSARAHGGDAVVWFEFAKETDWRLWENGRRRRRRPVPC